MSRFVGFELRIRGKKYDCVNLGKINVVNI